MWIKALYCTQDTEYARRLTTFFDNEYTNKLELNVCSSVERAMQLLKGIDIFLLGKEFEAELKDKRKIIPCPIVIMTEQIYDDGLSDTMQIEKYQRADGIYRQLLDFYAQGTNIKKAREVENTSSNQRIYVFTSANGGNGTTTVARAFAKKNALYEKTLYLDFGMYNDLPIDNGAEHGMDDIILALKSRRNILPLKLNSAVAQTSYGFYGYGCCVNPMDLLEINVEDIKSLIKELTSLTEYSKIIVDLGNSLTERDLVFLSHAHLIVYVLDEREVSVRKFSMFHALLGALEKRENYKLSRKIAVFRNKVSNDYSQENWPYEYEISGWAPFINDTEDETEIIGRIAASDSFNNLER